MIRLRVSRRLLHRLAWLVLALAVLAGLNRLGASVTPYDADGRPKVLSPGLWAAQKYRDQARGWAEQLAEIDRRLAELLNSDLTVELTEMYDRSNQMQRVGEKAARLSQRVTDAGAPVALLGLRTQAQAAADAYLNASVLVARWLDAPSQPGLHEAVEAMRTARALKAELEASRWLSR